ncbi:MAG TPA: alginate lyase family protein [Polyangiaceae bacterium]
MRFFRVTAVALGVCVGACAGCDKNTALDGGSGGTASGSGGRASGGESGRAGDGVSDVGGSNAGSTSAGGTTAGGPGSGGGPTGGSASGRSGAGGGAGASTPAAFVHPGLLFQRADLERMRAMVKAGTEPYLAGWNRLRTDARASLDYVPTAFAVVTRTSGGTGEGNAELRGDAARAFLHAVQWFVSENEAHAAKSAEILGAWASSLTAIEGDADRFLAAGLYGYLLANAGEILRHTYPGWEPDEQARFERMLLDIFYPLSHEFLETHAGSRVDHHFANWDAAQLVNIASIGVFADDRTIYEEAIDYFYDGPGNGNIMRAVFDGETGQLQESGRDQAHAQLGIGLLASLCETAWNQGDDLYSTDGNRLLKGFEYTASYLLGNEVPFRTYMDRSRTHTEISPVNREQRRPIYEMVLNHYAGRLGLDAPFTRELAAQTRPEGFHGDHPGFGTILHTR